MSLLPSIRLALRKISYPDHTEVEACMSRLRVFLVFRAGLFATDAVTAIGDEV